MEITSFIFFIFVGISLLIYWKLPQKFRWVLLLICSLIFYCFNSQPLTLIYLFISVVSVHGAAKVFEKFEDDGTQNSRQLEKKKVILTIAILLNAGILVVLKYSNLAIHTFNFTVGRGIGHLMQDVHWVAPLATSFYTLQLLAYLLDCYWGVAKPYKNCLHLLLYTCYFPQMVEGPISRYSDIGGQLFEKHEFDYSQVVHGLKRIAWGLMKKLAISNRVAVIVSQMWEDTATYGGFYIWIASMGFVIQLYTDFSGCIDIILGVSECFGINLPENFQAPLFSKTVQEFWQRWHITLGTWLRDYIMNPLAKSDFMVKLGDRCKKIFGKKRGKRIPIYLSMLVLWLCMGLWHGDSWKYILGEGLWFWAVIVSGQMLKKPFLMLKKYLHINEKSIPWQTFQSIRTFLIFAVGNLFFHADSLIDAIRRILLGFHFSFSPDTFSDFAHLFVLDGLGGKFGLMIAAVSFILVVAVDFCKYYEIKGMFDFFERHKLLRWIGYYAIVAILIFSLDIESQEIIYAQF